jgi:hypothetical protein
MRKDKIFELKIEEDDELSGIDSISLVDEPAIEVNWMFFKKEKEHDFHIPDGEDEQYLEKLMDTAQNEQELFDDGFEISSIHILDNHDDFVSTNPNGPSMEDEKEYRVRYKYILNPRVTGQSSVIKTTRQFCKDLVSKNYVWRVEDMEKTQNQFGQSAMVWRGGYNCRHVWSRIEYKKKGDIINKASVNKNKVDIGGFPSGLEPDVRVLGYEEPSTVTNKTLNNPSPSTIKNLGLSKEDMGYDNNLPPYVDQLPKKKKKPFEDEFEYLFPKSLGFESHSDYPESVKNNAKAVLKWVEENGWGSCGTDVGKQRANQLAKGEPISEDTIRRMYSYLSRHEVDLESSKGYGDGCGKLMYDSWGGKTALSWAESKINTFGKENMSKQHFQTDDEKRIVLGPAMIPNQKIFRKDALGNPYYVFFSSDTIKMIAEKYMKNQYTRNNDLMHDGEAVPDVFVYESWIKETYNDKSNKYGYGNLPIGTWFVSMKVTKTPEGDKVWDMVKSGELNGFSVSGYFEEVAKFSKEEMFLYKVAELLNNIEE